MRKPAILWSCLAAVALLCGACAGEPVADVTATTETLTLPYHTSTPRWQEDPTDRRALYPVRDSRQHVGDRDLETVVLENQYIRVRAIPEIGGVIEQAIFKPTGDEFFFSEGKLKDWLPWWETGVKVSFPYYEHGLGVDEPASWTVIEHADGGRTLAMWMEFSRHNQPFQEFRYGRYSNMTLSQFITLRPDAGYFSVTYRITNPAPYRQGRRLWNDTYFPRNQTADGVIQGDEMPPETTPTEWIFPTVYASDHNGHGFGEYDPARNLIGEQVGGSYSVFSWDIPFGFSGLYYPQVDVNRLRLFDVEVAPGNKQWYVGERTFEPGSVNHMYNYCELWGGTDNVFEGVEHWIGPGESYEMTFHYVLIWDIGRVDYADHRAALALDEDAGVLNVLTFEPVENLRVLLDGEPLAEVASAPDKPARIELPEGATGGTFSLALGDETILQRRLPLELPDDTSAHEEIRESMRGKYNAEMRGDADEHGNTWRKGIREYPAGTTDRGRVLLRAGRLEEAIADLTAATDDNPGDGEAWHLLGAALLEAGRADDAREPFTRAVEAEAPCPVARYYLAMLSVADGDKPAAIEQLDKLIERIPEHWHGKLLRAALTGSEDHADELVRLDPADPRAWCVARQSFTGDRADLAAENLRKLLEEPGAEQRLEEFKAAVEGGYVPPVRIER